MKKTFSVMLVLITAFITAGLGACSKGKDGPVTLGQPIEINEDYSFQYGWTAKPKMGTTTLKINVLDSAGEKVNDLVVLGSYDMPSMGGHYSQKPSPVAVSNNNDYLFPVQMTMAGEWIIVLSFQKDGAELRTETITVKI